MNPSPYFEAKLTTKDGDDFTPDLGEPTIAVVVGEDAAEDGLGETVHLGCGVWRYIAFEGEYGSFPTVVIFSAPDCVSQFDKHCGAVETPRLPEGWEDREAVSRIEFMNWIAGHTPRKEYAQWVEMLVNSFDPIPIQQFKTSLQRAYPKLFIRGNTP